MIASSTPNEYNNERQRNLQGENNRIDHSVVLPVNDDDDVIVEGVTVVRSQSERLNQQIRDVMYSNAITVEEDNVVALPDTTASATTTFTINPLDNNEAHKQRHPFDCDCNWRTFLRVIILAIVLATIFTTLHFTTRTKNDNTTILDMPPSTAPTRMKVPVTPSPTPSPTLPPTTTKFLEMQDLLSAQNLSSSAWLDPESPQYRALNWISNSDDYTINNVEIPVERIVQRYSLATFYYATGGDSEDVQKNQWKNNYNFLSNKSECLWNEDYRGISCYSNSSKVSMLWIAYNQLNGTIPVEIGSLKSVQAISLMYNNLYGEIPESLYNLDSLRLLGLASNKLSGTISSSLGKLKRMTNINLMQNELNGTIPSAMAELTNLTGLALDNNQLIGTIPDIFSKNCVTTMNLRQFSMSNNLLHGRVPASLWNISSLEKLALNVNQLSGELPDTIFLNLQNLHWFNVGSNRFNSSIPSIGAQYLANMEAFGVGQNELTGTIPSAMKYWKKLRLIDLGGNNLRGEIPSFIGNLTNLETLILDGNKLTGVVPESFQQLTRLNDLRLSHNLLYGKLKFMDFMCETRRKGGYFAFSADCVGTPPEIICSCCNICCDKFDECYYMVS